MENIFSSDDDLLDIDKITGKVDKNLEKTFQPWHKPRKQFIRENQWFNTLKNIISDSKYKQIQTIKYFGLPGGDLLDVTYISDCLLEHDKLKEKKFLIHGFINNDSEYRKAEIGISKLLDNSNISKDSKIEKFSFEDLYIDKSDAWNRIKGIGDYHFINLDFCDCALKVKTLTSIYRLLDYQVKRIHGYPWLLCITTRLNNGVAKDILEKFNEVLIKVKQDPDLISIVATSFKDSISAIDQLLSLGDNESKKSTLNELLQISLVYWLVTEAIVRDCAIELKSCYKYSVDSKELDMHSFVFSLERKDTLKPDLLGVIPTNGKECLIDDEAAKKIKIQTFTKLSNSFDIDTHLETNQELFIALAEKMMHLLQKCGYDVSNYKKEMNDSYGYSLPI